jgi:DNA modification methylase
VVPTDSVDVTITSPPYGPLKDYGSDRQIGRGQSYEEFLASLSLIFTQVFICTRETGSLWVVADTFKDDSRIRLLPFDLARMLEEIGWSLQDIIIWNKTKTLPWSRKGQLRNVFEYILFFTKTHTFKYYVDRIKEPEALKEWWVRYPERYNPQGKVPTNIWTFPIPVQGAFTNSDFRHACPFPRELIERILLLTTDPGDCVLDPFAGSGIALAQASVMGRKYTGLDVNPEYVRQFHRNVKSNVRQKRRKILQNNSKLDVKRSFLATQIIKLRQLKFPKALFNTLRAGGEELTHEQIHSLLSINSSLNGTHKDYQLAKSTVYILCNDGVSHTNLEEKARQLAEKPPLSKYGLVLEIHAVSLASFCRSGGATDLGNKNLFIYLNGRTNITAGRVTFTEWVSEHKKPWKRIPPIVSNIEVRQPLIHTWRAGNEEMEEEI